MREYASSAVGDEGWDEVIVLRAKRITK